MTIKKVWIGVVLILLITLGINFLVAPYLPEQVASHWNANGVVNGYQPKIVFLWTMPVIMLALSLLLIFLPLIDPLKANFMPVRNFYYWFVLGMLIFMLYIHGLSLAINLGIKLNLVVWMLPAYSALMLGIGFLLERARPNWFVGIRTPWTLSSPVVWDKTHHLGGWLYKIAGIITLVGMFFPDAAFWMLIVPLLSVSLFLVAYSYFIYSQEKTQAKS